MTVLVIVRIELLMPLPTAWKNTGNINEVTIGRKLTPDETEPNRPDPDYFLVAAESPKHQPRYGQEENRANRHQNKSEYYRVVEGRSAPLVAAGGVVEADERDNAGLHGPKRDEEESLPFVVKPKRRDGLIGETGKDHVQSEYVNGVGLL